MPKYMEFEVSFREIEPRIWRRLLLPEDATFLKLHDAIQDAGDWSWDHLFEFWIPTGRRGRIPIASAVMPDFAGGLEVVDESEAPRADGVPLKSYFTRAGAKCVYTYDFGDDWELDVQLKRTVELDEEFPRRLLDGARAFPPEDCGGVFGYYICLAAAGDIDPSKIRGVSKRELVERQDWLGDWGPEIDLAVAKDRFDHPEKYDQEFDEDDEDELDDDEDDELDDEDLDELDEEGLLDLFKEAGGESIVDPDAEGAYAGMALVEVVENQLRSNDPPEARQAYERLTKAGHSAAEAKRLIACALTAEVFDVMKSGKPHNPRRYAEMLARLPDLGFLDK